MADLNVGDHVTIADPGSRSGGKRLPAVLTHVNPLGPGIAYYVREDGRRGWDYLSRIRSAEET
jgi:hypothetical protein